MEHLFIVVFFKPNPSTTTRLRDQYLMDMYRKRIAAIHVELGIPQDYEHQTGLVLQQEEADLRAIENDLYGRPQRLAMSAVEPWNQLKKHAKQDGVQLQLVSAFRSVEKQVEIIQRKISAGGRIPDILDVSAAPGYSEHHTGLALDLTTTGCKTLEHEFDQTAAFAWLQKNASRFSFQLSYPKDNKHGIAYEPWHWALVDS